MRLLRLRLEDFRGVARREVELAPRGVTLVCGPNEAGKTSLADALDVLFELVDTSVDRRVREAQPVGRDAGPRVEAELELGGRRLRYAKRFLKERETLLEVVEPAAERASWTGREAHERMERLLAERLDRALWRALRMGQVGPEGSGPPRLGESPSLAAALDRAAGAAEAAGSAGQREETLWERARREYGVYFTGVRGQPTGPLREARHRLEAAREEEARLSRELEAVEADAERADELERRCSAGREAVAEAERRRDETAARLREVERLEGEVERCRSAKAELDHRAGRLAELAEARGRLEAVEADRSAAAVRLAEVRSEAGPVREAAGEAEERAAAAGRALEAARRFEQAERVLRAGSSRWSVVARRELEIGGEGGGGRRLGAGERFEEPVTGRRVLDLAGVATVTLEPGADAAALGREREVARDELVRALAAAGMEVTEERAGAVSVDPATVEAAAGAARERAGELAARADRLEAAAESAARVLRELEVEERAARERLERARAAVGELGVGVDREPTESPSARLPLDAPGGSAPAGPAQLTFFAEASAGGAASGRSAVGGSPEPGASPRPSAGAASLDAELDRTRREAEAAGERLEEARRRLAAVHPEPVHRAAEAAAVAAREEARRLRAAEDELAGLRGRLAAHGERELFERWGEARAVLAAAEREAAAVETRAAAAERLYRALAEAREAARSAYAGPLRERIVELGRRVYGEGEGGEGVAGGDGEGGGGEDGGFEVELDAELAVTHRRLGGRRLEVERLSAGAREQLALLTRLAAADLVAPGEGVPLLLDDALEATDPERTAALARLLGRIGEERQVILMTCAPERYAALEAARVVELGRDSS